jgi:uncharacterized HAD superfamily protein
MSKLIYVDIDGTICQNRDILRRERNNPNIQYSDVESFKNRIDKINKLYDEGNKIVYWTARGIMSGIDYTELTKKQLDQWGCKYHELIMNDKPHFDMYICDKSINADTFFST